jgi:hypothetical protein
MLFTNEGVAEGYMELQMRRTEYRLGSSGWMTRYWQKLPLLNTRR